MKHRRSSKKIGTWKDSGRRLNSASKARGTYKHSNASAQDARPSIKQGLYNQGRYKQDLYKQGLYKHGPYIVLSFTPGLSSAVKQELLDRFRELSSRDIRPVFGRRDELMVSVPGISIRRLLELRTVSQIFVAHSFSVNRPSGLISPENLLVIAKTLSQCLNNNPQATSFRFDAAGKTSSTMQRLAEKLFVATGLRHDPDEGDILLRIRPTPQSMKSVHTAQSNPRFKSKYETQSSDSQLHSWEVLTRATLLPLSTRDWRVANYRGALDATVAAAICRRLGLGPKDNFLNLMCGSGTLLIERALMAPAQQIVGVEIADEALRCAADNVTAARLNKRIKIYQDDVLKVRLEEGLFNCIVVNFPWGEAVGKKSALPSLYSMTLGRIDKLAANGAKLAILSQRDDLVLSLMPDKLHGWRLLEQQQIFQGGFTPTLFILEKSLK